MQKFVGAVIHMNKNETNINSLNQTKFNGFDELANTRPIKVFSDSVVEYLNQLSKILFTDERTKAYPDVGTVAFYCRQGNLRTLKKKFARGNNFRLGRGLIFHITPSNVPVNFAYSLIAGLLSGNTNVVRVPSKNFEQVQIIIDAINLIAQENQHTAISNRIILIRYDTEDQIITQELSSLCNVRVIWGGDETIGNIRAHTLSPRAFDLTFSDRYSICIINADSFVNERNTGAIVSGFYNDTFLFDQNACTSPHLVLWLGSKENVESSQYVFWSELHKLVKEKYNLQPIQVVDKITAFFDQALGMKDVKLHDIEDNFIWRIKIGTLEDNIEHFRSNSGYFSEYHAHSLRELVPLINSKYQTLAYYGFEQSELADFISTEMPNGIDRIVPIGKTMDFSLIWDGYDLINSLSRTVEII